MAVGPTSSLKCRAVEPPADAHKLRQVARAGSSTFNDSYALEDEYHSSSWRQYMVQSAKSTLLTGTGIVTRSGSAWLGINPRINLNEIPLERGDDLELLLETDVNNTPPFRTVGYDRYRKMITAKIHDHHRRGRMKRADAASEPPTMPHDESMGIVLREKKKDRRAGVLYTPFRCYLAGRRVKTWVQQCSFRSRGAGVRQVVSPNRG